MPYRLCNRMSTSLIVSAMLRRMSARADHKMRLRNIAEMTLFKTWHV